MLSVSIQPGEAALAGRQSESSATRAELNRQIRTAVKRFDVSGRDEGETWAFLCECGTAGCQEWVTMPVGGYEALHRADEPILAPGHTVSRGEKARRKAKRLADDSRALQAQAEQQVQRSRRSLEDREQ
jgi:hypothetical protein